MQWLTDETCRAFIVGMSGEGNKYSSYLLFNTMNEPVSTTIDQRISAKLLSVLDNYLVVSGRF